MSARKSFTLTALLALTAGIVPAAEVFVPYRQVQVDGNYIDWLDGHVGTMGRSVTFRDLNIKLYYLQARQKAEIMGQARMLKYLYQFPLDGADRLGNHPDLFEKVKSAMEKSEPASVEVIQPSTIKALIKVPLHGDKGIIGLMFPPAQAVAPPPAPPPAPSDAPPPPDASGGVTGLVIDATTLTGANPSLLPRITDRKGRRVYDVEQVDMDQARARGIAAFATRVEMRDPKPPLDPREGSNPLRVRAVSVAGPAGTEFVISETDAEAILKEAAIAPFLRECRVLILMPPAGSQPTAQPPARPKPLPKPREQEMPH
jgi:hypothetical protein